jgi:plasmid stability protein
MAELAGQGWESPRRSCKRGRSESLFRVLKFRAPQHNRSMEVEMRAILKAAMHPSGRLQTGKALSTMGRTIGLTNADVEALEQARDTEPAKPIHFTSNNPAASYANPGYRRR